MNTHVIVAALAAGIFLSSCAAKDAEEATTVDIAAEQQAIRDRSAAWMQAAQAKDAASIAGSFYSKNAILAYDGNVRRGREAIKSAMEDDFASSPEATVSWTTDSIAVAASGDLAYETGTITRDPDGAGPQPAVAGAFVTVWRKTESEWYAVADAGTEAGPPATATPAN